MPSLTSDDGELIPIQGAPPSLIKPPPGCKFAARCPLVEEQCLAVEPALATTDEPGHHAACHRREVVAAEPDATELFRKSAAAATASSSGGGERSA